MKSISQAKWFPLGIISLMLAACGGSGGGVGSTPTPTPTPTPTNSDVTDLKVNQTFAAPSGKNTVALEATTGIVQTTSTGRGEVTIAYDASNGTYTLTRNGTSRAFSPSDKANGGYAGERRFSKSDANGSDHLTLVDSAYASGLKTRSVGLGYWQSNSRADSRQNTLFDIFVYGFPTAAAPRTGSAEYTTDVFGLTTQVGRDPLTFTGSGKTVFDFERGNFTIDTNLQEYYFVTGAERFGALYFRASGNLTSADGGFSGSFLYDGSLDSVAGTVSGRFYGPNGEEAGGVFNGDNGAGGTVVGGFTAGNRAPVSQNMTLPNLQGDQLFYTGQSQYFAQQFKDGSERGYASADIQNGQLSYDAGSGYRMAGYSNEEGKFVEADRADSSTDRLAIYRKAVNGETIQLSLYKPNGPGELKLTYSSFGEYHRVTDTSEINGIYRTFFMYGLDTPEGVLTARPGSATYTGIAYGAASGPGGQQQFSVNGTSRFQIDFPSQSYSGWLKLQGTNDRNGSTADFGQFDLVAGKGIPRNAFSAGLTKNPGDAGQIQLRFYGPTGEEMAGAFGIRTADGFVIGGATAATRQ